MLYFKSKEDQIMKSYKPRKYEYSAHAPEQRPGESLEKYYNRLAGETSRRMTNLEKAANKPEFENVLKYAYHDMMYEIRHYSGDPYAERFRSGDLPLNVSGPRKGEINLQEARNRINAMKKFLEAPSSTVGGIREVYQKRAKALNDAARLKGAERLSWQDLAKYFESETAEISDATLNYTTLRAMGAIRRIAKDADKIKEAAAGNRKLSDDKIVNQKAMELLNSDKFDVVSIFKTK